VSSGERVNMLRRGESCWLCVKFEFGFIAGYGSLMIRVLPSSFLALTVDEVCLHFLPHPMRLDTLCFTFFVRNFLTGFSWLWAVGRFPYEIRWFWAHHFRVRVPHESSCFLVYYLLMRCHAFWAVTRFAHEMSCFSAPFEI
jgi:hypothetical protein